jgi:hypothetical protein
MTSVYQREAVDIRAREEYREKKMDYAKMLLFFTEH